MIDNTVLITAYAVNPFKGSEDGMGWNMIIEIAKYNKVIAITRENNEPAINRYLDTHKIEQATNIQWLYFDLPYHLRFWKRGQRGALLYFYLWQMSMPSFIKKQNLGFDIVHNLNFHNDWTPTFLWKLGKPLIWGPVGHHPKIPAEFLRRYGRRFEFLDQLKWSAKQFFWKYDPFLRKAAQSASAILAMNSEAGTHFPTSPHKFHRLPSVGSEPIPHSNAVKSDVFTILSVGRFVPLKGFDVTINAFAHFYHRLSKEQHSKVRLVLVGKGPSLEDLVQITDSEGIKGAVDFVPWMKRSDLLDLYQTADLFLFPSHEGAGMVVSEAFSMGLPVICFDNSGPGEFVQSDCGRKVEYGPYQKVVEAFADHLMNLYQNDALREQLSEGALKRHKEVFDWAHKGWKVNEIYKAILSEKEREYENSRHTFAE